MRAFIDKARHAAHNAVLIQKEKRSTTPMKHHQQAPLRTAAAPAASDQYSNPPPATQDDVFRYRYHHGCNLGSIFVLEKWLHPSMFPSSASASQTSELEAVKASVNAIGINATRAKWEQHWQSAISDADFKWLVNTASCTSIRLPVGYFTLSASLCKDTPFEPYTSVYANAWAYVKALVRNCFEHGIGVLLDLHALPGGANAGDHSGTNSGVAALWNNQKNLELATKCLAFIAQEIRNGPLQGVVGLQLCNEALYNAPGMYDWYDSVITQIGRIDNSIPLYISDAWDLPRCIGYAQAKNSKSPGSSVSNPVVIDTHLYWAFSDANKAMSPEQIIANVPNMLTELNDRQGNVLDKGAVQVCVGEYSCVMDGSSWAKTNGDRGQLVKQFGNAQCARWQQEAGGSFFWTYKMDWMPGGEWGFVAQSAATTQPSQPRASYSAVFPPPNLQLGKDEVAARLNRAMSQQDAARQVAVGRHTEYWNRAAPGKKFEHWRYEAGWKLGFGDASRFFSARSQGVLGPFLNGGDKIGNLEIWVWKRIGDSRMTGDFVWEFEQGVRAGVGDFYKLAGI